MSDKKDKPALRNSIEENLRKVYQDLMDEEVPDRFKQLLAQLRDSQNAVAENDDGEGVK